MKSAPYLTAIAAAALVFCQPTSAFAKDASADEVATCMWTKMPSSALVFLENVDRTKDLELFLAAASHCNPGDSGLNFKKMRKRLVAIRPATIGPDTMRADNVYVCTTGSTSVDTACKAPGGL